MSAAGTDQFSFRLSLLGPAAYRNTGQEQGNRHDAQEHVAGEGAQSA
jgi:hypothetical protein